MGILDAFKKKSPVEKAVQELTERYSQPEYRRTAMDKLFKIGTDEAYRGLMKRFGIAANGHIADESEKRDLLEELVRIGEPCVPAIKDYIANEKTITFPIRALGRIRPKAEALEFLVETLRKKEPLDHRTSEPKRLLLQAIGELAGPEVAPALLPYLDDHHDDVQVAVIEVLEKLYAAGEAVDEAGRAGLARVAGSASHSSRVQRKAAAALAELGWSVKAEFEAFPEELRADYQLGKKGNLERRTGAKA